MSNKDAVTRALQRNIAVGWALASRWRWDQPPALYSIRLSRGAAELAQFPVAPAFWNEAGSPEAALTATAAAFAQASASVSARVPADLYGVAFYSEVWAAPAGPGLAGRASRAGGIVNLPERTEARSIRAVDRTGTCYSLLRPRGGREIGVTVCPSSDPRVRDSEVLRALISMAGTFLGVSL